MDFWVFKGKVERWAEVRGIYEQSSEEHQQAKFLEELGEYLVATCDKERMDAIGDMAVCLVNASNFNHKIRSSFDIFGVTYFISNGILATYALRGAYGWSIRCLNAIAIDHGYKMEDCLQMAWDEIKDRKGMMVDGKYVKWDNLTDLQKIELEGRLNEKQ